MVFSVYIRLLLTSLLMYSIAAQTNTAYEISGTLNLYENGTVKYSPESPYCGKQQISLSSYNLTIKKCNNEDNRCQFPKRPLSPWAVMLLHEKCSLRKECHSLNLSSQAKELKNDNLHSVLIGYQCLGDEDRLYEMCGHQSETITGSMHLLTGKESRQHSSCQCLLKGRNDSVITVTLKDIRLYSSAISQRKCSKSVLKINEKSFACNATSSVFGSVFNQYLSVKAHNETTTVSLDFEDPEFDMVWLLVETQGSMSVECTGKRREVATTSVGVYSHPPTSNIQSDGSVKSDRIVLAESMIVVTVALVVAVLICTVICIICFRSRRRKALSSNCEIQEKSEVGKQCRHRSKNIEKADDWKNMSLRRRFLCWIRLLFDHKSIISRQNPQHQMSVESETVLVDKDDTKVDIHTHLASSSYDTEETPLSDETPMSDCYDKASNGGPVQESGQDGRDYLEEKRNAYAKIYPSLSKDGAIGNDQNNIYNNTQFKKQTPFRDPTYSHVPMERFPMTY